MTTNLTLAELKNILRAHDLMVTGNKPELLLRLEEADPEGTWVDEWRKNQEENESVGGGSQEGEMSMNGFDDTKQMLAALQAQVAALTLQLQQRIAVSASSRISGSPEDDRASFPRSSLLSVRANQVEKEFDQRTPQADPSVQLGKGVLPVEQNFSSSNDLQRTSTSIRGVRAVPEVIQQQVAFPGVEVSSRISINAISELLGNFDGSGQNFESWAQQVELIRAGYGLSDEITRIVISSKLRGKALNWFHSRSSHLTIPVEQLMYELKKMFFPQLSKIKLRRQFEDLVWSRSELFSEYVYNKVILANKANIDETDLVEYIIEGIPDESLRDQARMQRFKSKEDLLFAFEKITLSKKSYMSSQNKDIRRDSIKTATSENDNNKENKSETKDTRFVDKNKKKCYNCGLFGHMSNQCKKEKRPKGSCFRCGSTDHIIVNCPAPQKRSYSSEISNISESDKLSSEYYPNVVLKFENEEGIFDVQLVSLLDSGSPISIIKSKFVNPDVIVPTDGDKVEYYGVNNSKLRFLGKAIAKCQMNGSIKEIELLIVDDNTMTPSVILGRDTLRAFGLGFSKKQDYNEEHDDAFKEILHIQVDEVDIIDSLKINENVEFKYQQELQNDFKKFYVLPERPEVSKVKTTLKLCLKDHKIFNCAPRRLAFVEKEGLKKILDKLLQRKVIRVSTAEYVSPIVLIRKKMVIFDYVLITGY